MNRSLAALRGFYKFLLQEKVLDESPLTNIELAKVWMRLPDTVSKEEMNLILSQPGDQTPAALRDSAMLELLYATGLRVSELIGLTMNSINWQVGFLVVMGKGSKERVVPIGKTAYDCVRRYVDEARPKLVKIQNDGCFISESFRRSIYSTGALENYYSLRAKSRLAKKCASAYIPSFIRVSSFGGRGGFARGAGDAGACRYFDDANLYPCHQRPFEGDPSKISSQRVKRMLKDAGNKKEIKQKDHCRRGDRSSCHPRSGVC